MSRESRSCRSTNVLIKTTDGVLSRNRRIVFFSDGSNLRSEASTSTKADDTLLCPTIVWTSFCGSTSPDGTNAVVPSNIAAPVTARALRHRDKALRHRDVLPSDSGQSWPESEQASPAKPCRSVHAPFRYVQCNSRAALVHVLHGTTPACSWFLLPAYTPILLGRGETTTKPDAAGCLCCKAQLEVVALAASPTSAITTRSRQRALFKFILRILCFKTHKNWS